MMRRKRSSEYFDVPKTVRLSDSIMDALKERKDTTGVPVSTQIRQAVERELSCLSESPESPEIPVLGYIPASPASEVVYLPPGTTARPPFELGEDCYGLIVTGDSMTSDHGISIPSGSYAFFCSEITPHYGSIVHAEFPRDDGEHDCTLKRFCPDTDGVTVHFEPLNKKHKPITKKEGEYVIKGVFSRAWSAKE